MKTILTLFVLLGISVAAVAQTELSLPGDTLTFSGKVYDRETLKTLGHSVFIKNNKSYLCDEDGRFRFTANEGDTIVFHYVGYKDLILVVQDSIENEEYLTGIFLSPDMVQLSEVLVVPRHYDVETLVKTSPVDYSSLKIAEKNLRMSAYQGLMPNTNWDAETNQKYALKKESMRVEYKGMVAPDQTFGANLITVIPEAILTYGSHEGEQVDMGAITTQEDTYLTTVYDAIKKEKAKKLQLEKKNKVPLKQVGN